MSTESKDQNDKSTPSAPKLTIRKPAPLPLTNYSLSTVCPSCGAEMFRHACKVRCPKCGFMWDCSEL